MSELSELIKINRNIERQNDEIIRLLKRIAGEENEGEMTISYVAPKQFTPPEMSFAFDDESEVGEVHFIEENNVFRLSIKNNETSINNLTGSRDACNFAEQELIANESIKLNRAIGPATVILNSEQSMNLPETLKVCYEIKAKRVFIPWFSMTQLIGAPETLMAVMKLDFYKNEEQLIEKVFNKGD
ncbi:hypothetical protein [Methanobrevibacter sp.]|uniref:hypothetical protein n=1 Tax=Methanobrevibacter sp. TaxID=66852 RepID=UPI0038910CAA